MKESRGVLAAVVIAAALLLGARALLAPDPSVRAFEVFPDMVRSPALRSLEPSPSLPLGMVQQPLVPGVVVHGSEEFPYAAGPEECARAGRELANPLAPDDTAASERGGRLFARFCTPCHGADGEGLGNAVLRGMLPPPSFRADHAIGLKDGELYHILTRGQNNMASYAAQLAPEDRWKVILHLRALQRPKEAK